MKKDKDKKPAAPTPPLPGSVVIEENPDYPGTFTDADLGKRKGVTLGVTISMGVYEFIRVDVSTERYLIPGEDPKKMVEDLGAEVFRDLKTMTTSLVQEFKALRKEAFDDFLEDD